RVAFRRVEFLRDRGDGDYVVETHHQIGNGDDPDRAQEIVDRLDLLGAAVLFRPEQLDGDPQQQRAAYKLEIGDLHQRGDGAGEYHPQADGDDGAEHHAPQPLLRRELAASERDDDGVV